MELDKETLEMIVATHTNVEHILEALKDGKKTFRDHTGRIQELEKKHQSMKGKLSVITKLVTSIIAVVSSFILYLWFHLISR